MNNAVDQKEKLNAAYAALGLEAGATANEARRARNKLLAKYHPDKNRGNTGAAEKFQQAQDAYDLIEKSNNEQVEQKAAPGPGKDGGLRSFDVQAFIDAVQDPKGPFGGNARVSELQSGRPRWSVPKIDISALKENGAVFIEPKLIYDEPAGRFKIDYLADKKGTIGHCTLDMTGQQQFPGYSAGAPLINPADGSKASIEAAVLTAKAAGWSAMYLTGSASPEQKQITKDMCERHGMPLEIGKANVEQKSIEADKNQEQQQAIDNGPRSPGGP